MSFPWVPASIAASRQPHEPGPGVRLRPKRLSLLIALALGGTAMTVVQPPAQALPPVVAAPARNALPWAYDNGRGSGFFTQGGAVKWEYPKDENGQIIPGRMLITQESLTAIGRFHSFDIGQDASVVFDQQAGNTSQFLGRIDATGVPSRIFGTLEANGSVYLINQNGVVFGSDSQVNARSFIFSALDIRDEKFLEGFDKGVDNPDDSEALKVFEWNIESAAGNNPNNVSIDFDQTYVQVLPGARITSKSGGNVLLLAPHVVNGGDIRTPQGQAILAGGAKVYLQFSEDPDLRGMLVEVDPLQSQGATVHGSAINAVTGSITADEGNITLAAFTVKQHGNLTATTSVRQNGSIYLKAQDGAKTYSNTLVEPNRWELRGAGNAGELEIGNGTDASVTEVNPVASNDTSQDGQGFTKSNIQLSGGQITFNNHSLVRAAGGDLTVSTETDKSDGVTLDASTDRWIDILSGARLDVSGTQDVEVSVSRNFIQTTPYSSELKDTPTQRDGFLYRQPLWIDVRNLPEVADFSGYLSQVERGVGERTATGGNISLTTRGQVFQRAGSSLDVSGGSIQYQGGLGRTTQLISGDKVYDIGDAPTNLNYDGFARIYTRTLNKWNITETWGGLGYGKPLTSVERYYSGYLEGKDAGSIKIVARGVSLEGELAGDTISGQYQRDVATLPVGGQFELDLVRAYSSTTSFSTLDVTFSNDIISLDPGVTPDTPLTEVTLATRHFSEGGFGQVNVASEGGTVSVPGDVVLNVQPGGSVSIEAGRVSVEGQITTPGGEIALTTVRPSGTSVAEADMNIGPNAILSARGLWTNDMQDPGNPFAPVVKNGGKVTLDSYGDLTLAEDSQVDVSGGGWVNGSGALQGGAGGDITLRVGHNGIQRDEQSLSESILTLPGDGNLRSYGIAGGGSLTLDVAQARIGGTPPSTGASPLLHLDEDFFQRGGFKEYTINTRDGLTVAEGATVRAQMERLRVDNDFQLRASGADLYDFTQRELPILVERTPVELNLEASNLYSGKLVVETGASIATDIGGSINLSAARQIIVDGMIEAPAGVISLTLGPDDQASYIDDQYIWLGTASRLLTPGAAQTMTDYAGLTRGEVLSGGRIALNAKYGYIVSEEGSLMDVSGTSGHVDIVTPGGARTTNIETRQIASDAGEISLTAAESMLLYGNWRAFAGGDTARGGTLKIEMTTPNKGGNAASFPSGPRRILVSDGSTLFPSDVTRDGISATSAYNGGAFLARARIQGDGISTGGFDSLSLRASDRIEFTESVNLSMDQWLMLDAPAIAVWQSPLGMPENVVELSAPYLMFGNTPNTQGEGHVGGEDASPGTSELRLQGQLIDLVGDTVLQGVSEFSAFADSDIRLRATDQRVNQGSSDRKYEGRLSTYADITLQADQIYPTTMSDFTLHVVATDNPDGRVTILPGDGDSPVLSAGGRLVIDAPNIDQQGVLKAPFGEISFIAGNSLHLWEGSLTSVSGEGQLVPFGYTEGGGTNLYYDYGLNEIQFGDDAGQSAPPEKAVRIKAENFVMDEGARVDVRGGGDLYTYEFTPGPPGRSIDILDPDARSVASSDASAVVRASAAEYDGTYAILPSLGSAFAPYDQQAYLGAGAPIPGSSVYLSGIPGLAAGVYALLPARYALLPGAFLIKQVSGYQDMTAGQRSLRPDGTYLTSGYFTSVTNPGTTVRDARTSGFEIRSADRIKYEADYGTRTLSDWIAGNDTSWQAPADAGRFVINATQSLELNGSFLGTPDASRQGQGGQVDILGTNIVITDDVTPDDNLADTIQIKASTLTDLEAASLLIGGERRNTASGVQIEVSATAVTVANNSDRDSELRAPEIMLAATDSLTLNPNSVILARGNARLSSAPLTLTSANPNNTIPGQSAFVRVASGAQVGVLRAHDQNNSGTVGNDTGTLLIGAGARLTAESNSSGQSSMTLDATRSMTNSGTWQIGSASAPGDLAIGAARISLGAVPDDAVEPGLILNNQQIADLGDLNTLDLRSYSSIDIYGGAQLSARSNLGLEAGQIRRIDSAGSATIHAGQDLRFSNPNGIVASAASSAASGTLTLSAGRDLTLGAVSAVPNSGDLSIGGYQNVSLSAGRDLAVDGKGSLTVAADLALNAQRITGRNGADFEIKAQDSSDTWRPIVIGTASTPWVGTLPAINDAAARLKIVGGSVTHGGVINMPSGVLQLEAMDQGGNVELLDDASIIAQGVVKQFDTQYAYAPGGAITLSSASGDVILGDGTSIDVSGAAGGDAGAITVQAAHGEFDLKGQLRGMASARTGQTTPPAGGSFTLDAGSIADFTDTNGAIVDGFTHVNRVLQAGGFDASRHVRVRDANENLVLAAAETITARDVRLVADAGDVDIAGDIDARGTRGGSVELWANGAVRVRDGAVIDASALPSGALPTEPGQRGGSVLLATQDTSTTGGINVESGAIVDVTGTGIQTDSGSVHLRAPRIGTAEDEVAVSALRGTIRGAWQITIEAFKAYTPGPGATLYDSISGALSEADTFISNFGVTLTTRLRDELALGGNASDILDGLQVRPGIEIESSDSLQLDTALNLWGASSSPGVLTLRTDGNLTFNANLSDGFSTATSAGVLQSGDSWSYRLVAGAELDSADAMAVQPLNTLTAGDGNFSMADNTLVRTGTGNIDIAAGRDVRLGSGAVIYTAGQADIEPLANFVPPTSAYQPNYYPLDGGDLSIQAQGDLVSAQPRDATGVSYQQVVTDWLWRQGNYNTGANQRYLTWYPRFDAFKQGVAAFGGGDIRVAAGGDIDNFSVSLPTSGRLPATVDQTGVLVPDLDNQRVLGGGDMSVIASGDILSGVYYLGAGTGKIQARGSLGSSINVSRSTVNPTIPLQPLYTILALADGWLDVSTGGSLSVQTIMNPTVFPLSPRNISRSPGSATPTSSTLNTALISNFYTYSTDSAVSLTAISGDVHLENNNLAIEASSSRFNNIGTYGPGNYFSTVYPATFRATALSGDILVKDHLTLYPSPQGQLELFAGGSISFPSGAVGITVPDIWPENSPTLATLLNPQSSYTSISAALDVFPVGFNAHSVNSTTGELLHADDLEPIRIIALTGDVIGSEQGIGNFPKPLVLQAGRDLIDVGFYGQNLDDNDITRIQAGRDLRFTTRTDASGKLRSTEEGVFIGGPGRVEVITGRDIDLGTSVGILTKGNINNPHLPEGGASLMALAGAAPALSSYPAFIAYYLEGACVDEQASYMCDLREMMRTRTGDLDLSDSDALAQFNSLAPEQQTAFVNHILFSELRRTGREAIDPEAEGFATYDRGYDAIARLFPTAAGPEPAPAGNINLYYSQLKTEQGGDIELLAPYGRVVAGLPTATVTTASFNRSAAQLGIVTVNGGAIRAMTRDDFLVNSQRVFTLQGGDILLWSSEGNIDAGRGAKTASATPPPRLRRKSDGTVVLDLTQSISGSGIAALRANPDVTPGDVDLIAPRGTVNAGDAGIRALANLSIAAQQVIGADNIQVVGLSAGLPVADTSGLGAAAASAAAAGTGKASEDAFKNTDALDDQQANLEVDVLGFGENELQK